MASQRGSPEVASVVDMTALAATAGAREGLVVLAAVVRCCTRSLGEFGIEIQLLGMLAGDEEDGRRARLRRRSGLRKSGLMGRGGCWSV